MTTVNKKYLTRNNRLAGIDPTGPTVRSQTLHIHPDQVGTGDDKLYDTVQAAYNLLLTTFGTPSATNIVGLVIGVGDYGSESVTGTSDYIYVTYENEAATTGISISGSVMRGVGSNSITVTPDDDLQERYDWLASSDRDGQMGAVSDTAKRIMYRYPGSYTGNLSINTKNVYVVDMDGVSDSGAVTYTTVWYGSTIGDGSGDSLANAINIDSREAYLAISAASSDWGKYFLLTKDIDFAGVSIDLIGTNTTKFTGTFDGNQHTLRNGLVKNDPDAFNAVALFRRIGPVSVVRDINLENISVIGSSPNSEDSYIAILVGETTDGSLVDNCILTDCHIEHTHTQASEISYVGGLIAASHGTITNCKVIGGSVKADITAGTDLNIGGFVGYKTTEGSISGCSSSAYVGDLNAASTITSNCGGFVGDCATAGGTFDISDCHSTGKINYTSSALQNVGGFAGFCNGIVLKSSYEGSITTARSGASGTTDKVGGFVGDSDSTADVDQCYAIADMFIDMGTSGTAYVGGFVGEAANDAAAGTFTDCYAKGTIYDTKAGSTVLTFSGYGGFCGYGKNATIEHSFASVGPWTSGAYTSREGFIGINTSSTITDCFWDTTVATHATAGDGTEATTTELMTKATTAFTFTAGVGPWKMQLDDYDYPKLVWE